MSFYSPLAASEVRLLTIKSIDRTINCEIAIYSQADVVDSYSALSYEWGPEPPAQVVHEIQVNEDEKRVWIDAICLNQQNFAEKELHVPLMGEIYTHAYQVFAFLGAASLDRDEELGSDVAMDCINTVATEITAIKAAEEFERFRTMELPPADNGVWPALALLLHRGWFERLWIWQEVILAKRLYLGCGTRWTTFDQLTNFIMLLQARALQSRVARNPTQRRSEGIFFTWELLMKHREAHQKAGTIGLPVPALLHFFRSRKCKEPVDRIWGSRALWEGNLSTLSNLARWLDYSDEGKRNYWNTYITMAKFYIPYDPTLLFISLAASQNKCLNLPSWCPDWNTCMAYDNFGAVGWFNAGFDGASLYGRRSNIIVHDDSNTIQVCGIRVDVVQEVVKGLYVDPSTTREKLEAFKQLLAWEEKCLELSTRLQANRERSADGIPSQHWRTLIADGLDGMKTHNTKDLSADYQRWKQYLEAQSRGQSVPLLEGTELTSTQRYFTATRDACLGRQFFSTNRGNVGLGPVGIVPGDVVCAFDSGASLYILRWDCGRIEAKLIGDAYVCELMTIQQISMAVPAAVHEIFSIS